jgi:hypothetical protein
METVIGCSENKSDCMYEHLCRKNMGYYDENGVFQCDEYDNDFTYQLKLAKKYFSENTEVNK